MITLHLYRDRNGRAVAKIDTPDGRVVLSDGDKEDALALLTEASATSAHTAHPREPAEHRIVSRLAGLMRAKLAKRRRHGHWAGMTVNEAMDLLRAEMEELEDTLDDRDRIAEAVDVANCCAILIDVLAGDES